MVITPSTRKPANSRLFQVPTLHLGGWAISHPSDHQRGKGRACSCRRNNGDDTSPDRVMNSCASEARDVT